MLTEAGTTKYRHNGIEHVGTYEVAGFILTLTCAFGVFKTAIGLADHQKLARNLLKAVCVRAPGTRDVRRAPVTESHPETTLAGALA